MNCRDIENLLDSGAFDEFDDLPPVRQVALEAHLSACESCDEQWQAAQALYALREMPAPRVRSGFFTAAMRRAVQPSAGRGRRGAFCLGAGVGGALAASIAAAVMSLSSVSREDAFGGVPALAIALNQPQDVSVAINSQRALIGARIRVVLTGGIELAGYAGQSVVSWETDLDSGVNRLTLPVIAVRPVGGQVLVEVEHHRKRQVFIVDVGVAPPVAGGLSERTTAAWRPAALGV